MGHPAQGAPRGKLARALIIDIVADVDEAARAVILTIHWQGGQHSQLRARKPRTGEHGCSTTDEPLAVIRSMATRCANKTIASSRNATHIPPRHATTSTP